MTKEQLEALGLDAEQIKEVFKLNGIAVNNAKGDLSTKEQELADAKKLLEDANNKIEGFKDLDVDAIKKEAQEYKEAFEKAEREGKEKLEALQYETELEKYMNSHTFASERIKNSIYNDMKNKGFKLEDGKFLGADDYIKQLQEKEPESFATKQEDDKAPRFTKPNNSNTNGNGLTREDFNKLSYTERMEINKTNKSLYDELTK